MSRGLQINDAIGHEIIGNIDDDGGSRQRAFLSPYQCSSGGPNRTGSVFGSVRIIGNIGVDEGSHQRACLSL